MHLRIALALALAPAPACASHEDGSRPSSPTPVAAHDPAAAEDAPPTEPQPDPDPEPQAKSRAEASIASVQMIQDCPDPAPSPASPAAAPAGPASKPMPPAPPAKRESRAARGSSLSGRGPRQPCTQSTMQLAFTAASGEPARVVIERVTMLDAESSVALATIAARRPMAWVDGSYREWDETLPGEDAVKASYSLRVPNWAEVEATIGGTSFGHMFVVEVELTVDGERQLVRSPAFTRERPHVIVT